MQLHSLQQSKQLELLKGKVCKESKKKIVPSKRINIVKVQLIREKSMLYKDRIIRSPRDAYELIRDFLGDVDREHFVVLCLDTKNQPTCIQVVHIGSLNSSIVHPREVLKPALLSNAASIIVAHNHPSNIPNPSSEDISVTKRLAQASKIIGIELLDHLIICTDTFHSLKDTGHM